MGKEVLEDSMPKKLIRVVVFGLLALAGARWQVRAQTKPPAYPAAAPLDQYLFSAKDAEIALARSAAPPSISDKAEVLVLGRDGYTTAEKGGNGFVCFVERSWGKTTDDPEFWNPKVRAPLCVNAPAAKSYLPIVLLKTKLALAGKTNVEIAQAVKSALDRKEWPAAEPNAMCYMMSKQQYLSDDDMNWRPHMMWFVAGDAAESWGANLDGVPAMAGHVPQDRMTVFMIPVRHWSDGTLDSRPVH
jgi:hypothetical protein